MRGCCMQARPQHALQQRACCCAVPPPTRYPSPTHLLPNPGFLYDSSIPEPFPSATSPDGNTRLWPYTMDYGLPQRCDLGTGAWGTAPGLLRAAVGGAEP